jgi:prepilin-type N-terminal cleavage/methylation domain-containing protein
MIMTGSQKAVGSRQLNTEVRAPAGVYPESSLLPAACGLPPAARGFTLIEMLVVVAIIVLGMTLAIPAIRSLTGSRSVEAAENSLSSFINFTRTEAIGLQQTEGVIFLLDTTTDRVKCAVVVATGVQSANDVPNVTYLDLAPDHDPYFLPTGIRVWTMKDQPPPGPLYADPFPGSHYLGFNPNPNLGPTGYGYLLPAGAPQMASIPGGVILFDKTGRLISTRYGLRLNPSSQLGQMIYPSINQSASSGINPADWPNQGTATSNLYLSSQIGLVLFDREAFVNQTGATSNQQFTDANDTGGNLQTDMENWLNTNTTAVFVNRYDGNLMRAE